MKRERAIASALGLATALIWGLSFLSIKVAVTVIPPMSLGLWRFIVAVAVLPLVALATKERLSVERRDLPRLAAGGLAGVTLYFLCENNGILLLSASEASLIIGSIPVLTMLAERLFLKTRLGARSYVGAVLSLGGVGLIAARSPGAVSTPMGFVYMAGAALAWVAYSFLTRPLGARYGRVAITFWQSLFGLVGFLPFVVAEIPAWVLPGPTIVLHVLYLGIFCSALGYWFYVTSLDILGAGPASAFINLIPVVSVVA
ncbi:MAG: DMT family transporter, partial [Spirochaetaceae bacterium]|nr:DMT family transporter [Spirochaetaceae bacterium]